MISAMSTIIRRELLIAFRRQADILNPLWFFIIVITLFPLSIGPEPNLLARIAAGIVWVAALLSALLSLERLFRDDYQDGALEQMMLMPIPLQLVVISKVIAHWLLTGLPLILISPLLAILLSLDFNTWLSVCADISHRYTDIEFYRCYWCSTDCWVAKRRRSFKFANSPALHPNSNFRYVRD